MKLMSAREAGELWEISQRRVVHLCREGRIAGATIVGGMWVIPAGAVKPKDGRTVHGKDALSSNPRPFLKWAGGKRQLLPEIRRHYKRALQPNIKKYAEPFVGGGAVLFDIIKFWDFREVYISDINHDLINVYTVVRDNVEELVDQLSSLEESFLSLDSEAKKQAYYKNRDLYNETDVHGCASERLRKAALLIFLNKTCFNGLYRVNRKGFFNVPMGSYKKPLICDRENLFAVSDALQNVQIVCGEFTDSDSFIDDSTLVYFDPPYRPLNATSRFTSYTENEFDDAQQKLLGSYVDHLDLKRAKIILSNSDPKNVDPGDDFFDAIYAKYKIERIGASRMINSKGTARGKISEIIVTNF